jgi:hypothetical protein
MKWSANQEDERRAQLLLGQCIERNPLAVASTAKRTELVVNLPVTPALANRRLLSAVSDCGTMQKWMGVVARRLLYPRYCRNGAR